MASTRIRRLARGVAYLVFLAAFAIVTAEVFLRITVGEADRYYVYPPDFRADFIANAEGTPGVAGVGRFWTNSLGLRSDEPPANAERVIYTLGGSTTVDLYLDQDETWVQQLQAALNREPKAPVTWIGNLGKQSLATVHHLLHMKYLLPELPQPQILLNLVGVNDLQLALKSTYLGPISRDEHLHWAFHRMPSGDTLVGRSALARQISRLVNRWRRARFGVLQTANGSRFADWRRCRQSAIDADLIYRLPDLDAALLDYRRNLNEMIDRAADIRARMIFATQPTLWSETMGREEAGRLLAGGVGPSEQWCEDKRYYAPVALARGMRRFNDVLRSVCHQRGLSCIDLDDEIPKEARYFRDDMHFSEAGATRVSQAMFDGIRTID